ncbi:YfiR family protein [Methylibium sp.]|uniref:YfiR family protein n=1 Tax=Methylibium sp. TaxID=2067992 RepID=UPI003D0C0ADB
MVLGICGLLSFAPAVLGDNLPEYRLKAAFLYNFAVFTEWPIEVGTTLKLCVLGRDPFGPELDELNGKAIGGRSLVVQRLAGSQPLSGCQVLFIAPSAIGGLPRVLEAVSGSPVLTVADSPHAAREGVAINMAVRDSKVLFEVNLKAVRGARLNLSSKLLRLAKEVYQ